GRLRGAQHRPAPPRRLQRPAELVRLLHADADRFLRGRDPGRAGGEQPELRRALPRPGDPPPGAPSLPLSRREGPDPAMADPGLQPGALSRGRLRRVRLLPRGTRLGPLARADAAHAAPRELVVLDAAEGRSHARPAAGP